MLNWSKQRGESNLRLFTWHPRDSDKWPGPPLVGGPGGRGDGDRWDDDARLDNADNRGDADVCRRAEQCGCGGHGIKRRHKETISVRFIARMMKERSTNRAVRWALRLLCSLEPGSAHLHGLSQLRIFSGGPLYPVNFLSYKTNKLPPKQAM